MIFLDNASTTWLSEEAKKEIIEKSEAYFNASASYRGGLQAKGLIDDAKKAICETLHVKFDNNLIFTGSATEANNLAIFGSAKKGGQYLFSEGEHLSVYNTALELKNRGYNVKFVPLTSEGKMDLNALESLLNEPTAFLSCIHVNNETGAINDIEKINKILKSKWPRALFHSDGVQAFGKINVNLSKIQADLYSISAHKIGGPKGIGALYVKDPSKLKPIIFGGGQEYGIRSGTENLMYISAFKSVAKERSLNLLNNYEKVSELNHIFKEQIKDSGLIVNSPEDASPYILSLSAAGVKGETLVRMCDDDGLCIGTGSACSSKKSTLNRILKAMNKNTIMCEGAIRISFAPYNTNEEVITASEILVKNYKKLLSNLN